MLPSLPMLKVRFATTLSLVVTCAFGLLAVPAWLHAEENTNKSVRVVTRKEGETTRFFVQNMEPTEITATFELKLTNLKSSVGSSYTATYPPSQLTEAFTVWPARGEKQWSYSYVNHFTMGSTKAVHDDSYIYTLPIQPGSEGKVTQGYNGSYSHTGSDQYAIDWKMAPGTPVHAARGGVVVKVKVDSNVGGPDRKYENSANYILVRHSDGTLANYAHLSKDGAKVKVGQIVAPGDLLGLSGNTGFTSGPHLHFSVFKTKDGKERQSIPVKFRTANSGSLTLVEGKTYKCVVPAKAVVAKNRVSTPAVSATIGIPIKPVTASAKRDVKS